MARFLLYFLLAFLPLAFSFKCYDTTSLDKRITLDSSTSTTRCSTQCYKFVKSSPMYVATYGCDSSKTFCADVPNGKCKTVSGVKTCCCNSELCNSIGTLTSIFSLITTLLLSFIA